MTRPDPFEGQPHHALRPWTDLPPDDPAPTPRPPVTVGSLDVDGLRELLGRPIRGLFGGCYCPWCAGVIAAPTGRSAGAGLSGRGRREHHRH